MSLVIDYETMRALGGKDVVDAQVAAFQQALIDHASTTDVPAPSAPNSIVEAIVRQYGGQYTAEDAPPEPPEPPAPSTSELINIERDNRTFPGPILVTSDALPRAIPVDMRVQKDRDNLGNLTTGAIIAKASGKTGPYINFGDADNAVTPLTADQVIILGTAGLIYGSAVWEASRALKKMDPIPPDFRDDKYWPVPAVTI